MNDFIYSHIDCEMYSGHDETKFLDIINDYILNQLFIEPTKILPWN